MARLLTDDDVRPVLTPQLAMDAVREVIRDHATGAATGGPRVSADLGAGELTFTAGATPQVYGYRSYDSMGTGRVDQVVTCFDRQTRRVKYVHVGSLVGISRTGAIGGVAVDAMADPSASRLAVIGSGIQAYWQVWAIAAARELNEIRVYSPTPQRRMAFATRVKDKLGLPIMEVAHPRDAVADADIVVLATTATDPVIDTSWLADGTHVNALGRKEPGAAEYDGQLIAQSFITTDSVAQLEQITGLREDVDPLGLHLAPTSDRLHGKRLSLFQSCGLAGTEVTLLNALGEALA